MRAQVLLVEPDIGWRTLCRRRPPQSRTRVGGLRYGSTEPVDEALHLLVSNIRLGDHNSLRLGYDARATDTRSVIYAEDD